MTIPKWLLPVLSIVAALAVGVAATLIGMNFPPHEAKAAPIVEAPVLQPVDPNAKKDAQGNSLPSDATGSTQIVAGVTESSKPGSPPVAAALPNDTAAFQRVLAQVGASIDPAATVAKIQRDAGETPTQLGGDPCSPLRRARPAGCPTGVTGAIFALAHAPALAVSGQAYPPTESDFNARGNPLGNLWCEPHSDLGPNDVPFGILTTAPATFVVHYFPDGHSAQSRTLPVDAPDNVDAWNSALPGAATEADLPALKQCPKLPDLTPNTLYDAFVVATAPNGQIAISNLVRFNSSRQPVRPPATFTPMGDHIVFAQGLVGHEQQLKFRGFIVNDSAADRAATSHTCSVPNGQEIVPAGGRSDDLSASQVQALNAPASYNLRLTETFTVPEGATVLFCARWYPATTHAPSWTREQPEFETSTFLGAPDRILPVLTEIGNGFLGRPGRATTPMGPYIWAQTETGIHCGENLNLDGGVVNELAPGRHLLCDSSSVEALSTGPEGGRFWDQPFTGNLVVGSEFSRLSDSTHRWVEEDPQYAEIPAGLQNCFGVCALPAPTTFVLPLGPAYYDCSHRQLDVCTPLPDSGWGQYQIELSWKQGLTNGVGAGWGTTSVNDVSLDWHQPDLPRMNTDNRLTSATAPGAINATLSFRLEADRPVHYVATLFNPATNAPPCLSTNGSAQQDGAAANAVTLTWPGVCGGQAVAAEIVLTDDATGLTSRYDFRSSPAGSSQWGLRGVVLVPVTVIAPRTLHVSYQFVTGGLFGWSAVEGTFVPDPTRDLPADQPHSVVINPGDSCAAPPTFSGSFDFPVSIEQQSDVDLAYTVTTPGAGCTDRPAQLITVDIPVDYVAINDFGHENLDVNALDDHGTYYQIFITISV